MPPRDQRSVGLTAGVSAYLLWGLMPLFWQLLRPASALEILAHRVAWSFVAVGLVLVALRRPWTWLGALRDPRLAARLAAASALIAGNWLVYIWSVNAGFVVAASLGYFINPLVNVLLGVLLFGERLGAGGKVGGLLALAGVVVIAWSSWSTLWVSLALALSFGLYGVVKKRAPLPALPGLLVESGLTLPLAVGYLVALHLGGGGQFGTSASASLLLAATGVATALPLWLFAIAAPRLPFGVTGVLQYIAPTITFVLGITVLREHVSASYWAGLVLVWAGSAVYLSATLRRGDPPA